MQSGLLYGYVGQVEYLISRFKQEMAQPDIKVIATGGMSRVIGNGVEPGRKNINSYLRVWHKFSEAR